MRQKLKKTNLFAFSILIFSGLFSFSINNSDFTKDDNVLNNPKGTIIDFEAGNGYYGATVDADLDGFADTLYMWGDNSSGQIGTNSFSGNYLMPIVIEPKDGWNGNLIDLSLGENGTSGVTVDTDHDGFADTLYMWGKDESGQVGNNTITSVSLTPNQIKDQSFWNGNLLDLNIGYNDSGILVDSDLDGFGDKIYMWGDNVNGALGIESHYGNITFPTLLNFPSSKIIDFDLGSNYSGVIADDGDNNEKLYMWGYDENNNFSNVPTIVNSSSENPNWLDNDLLSLDFNGNDYTLLSDYDGDNIADSLWVWGDNNYNQLNSGNNEYISDPILSSDFNGDDGNIINISNGSTHMGIIVDSNKNGSGDKVFTRGYNSNGQIGNNTTTNQEEFVEINFSDKSENKISGDFKKLAFSKNNSGLLADLDGDGNSDTIYTWGNNNFGQIGNNAVGASQNTPYFAFSLIDLNIDSISAFALDSKTIIITMILNDLSDFYNEENIPTIKFVDSNGNELTPLINEEDSDFASDKYVYTLSELSPGTEYKFTSFIFDDNNQFEIDYSIITDYLISGVSLDNVTETTATLNLDLSENNDFNTINFDDSQRQVKINFDDDTSSEEVINDNNQIVIDELNSFTSYNIESIDYNFDKDANSYKYNVLTEGLSFQTLGYDLILEADSFVINDSNVTSSSFEYNVNINNLYEDENGVFTNYDLNDGLYLIDKSYNSYKTSYVEGSKVKIGAGEEEGTFEYQFTFKMNNLSSNKDYSFIGISFVKSFSQDNPSIVYFENDALIKTKANKDNIFYIWTLVAAILILVLIIVLIIFANSALKKRNLRIIDALNVTTSKN